MPKVTIHNRRRVSVIWGSHRFPARAEKTVELDQRHIDRIRQKRGLRIVRIDESSATAGAAEWGATVKSALEYVGDDAARAAEVLEAEKAKGDKARKSLVAQLEAVIAAGDAGDESDAGDDSDAGESEAGDSPGEED